MTMTITKKSHGLIEFNGEVMTVKEWADRLGLTTQALYYRLAHRSIRSALSHPKASNRQPRVQP